MRPDPSTAPIVDVAEPEAYDIPASNLDASCAGVSQEEPSQAGLSRSDMEASPTDSSCAENP